VILDLFLFHRPRKRVERSEASRAMLKANIAEVVQLH